MKKNIMILMIGILLIGGNVYAQGDLVVNGKIGVGVANPAYKLHVESDNEQSGLRVISTFSNTPFGSNSGAIYSIKATQSGISLKKFKGFQGEVNLIGDGTDFSMAGSENVVTFNATGVGSTVTDAKGLTAVLRKGSLNTVDHTLTSWYGFHSMGQAAGLGKIDGTDWRHGYFENFENFGGTITNVTGLWIDQQTRGTNNYGIVLDGDGAGANIVFGPNQEASIYSSAGELFAKDSLGNVTQISPHDPVTGEWIYYSKNIKSGVVKKVNMEKLIKAVEKLTGETFMVETLIED